MEIYLIGRLKNAWRLFRSRSRDLRHIRCSSTTATRKVESTVEVDAATAASSVQFDTSGLDSSMDEYYAEYDSLTAFYGMDYATKLGSYSSYYTA